MGRLVVGTGADIDLAEPDGFPEILEPAISRPAIGPVVRKSFYFMARRAATIMNAAHRAVRSSSIEGLDRLR